MRRIDKFRAAIWDSDEPPSNKLLLLALAEHMDFDTLGSCHPGRPRLVSMTGLSDRSVKRLLKDLQRDGWLVEAHRGGGRGRATIYQGTVKGVTTTPFKGGHHDPVSVLKGVTSDRKGGHHDPPPSQDQAGAVAAYGGARPKGLADTAPATHTYVDDATIVATAEMIDRAQENIIKLDVDAYGCADDAPAPYWDAFANEVERIGWDEVLRSDDALRLTPAQIDAIKNACIEARLLVIGGAGPRPAWAPDETKAATSNGQQPPCPHCGGPSEPGYKTLRMCPRCDIEWQP